MIEQSQAITLLEFNSRISRLLKNTAVQNCWVIADLSDVAVRGGHCYLELVQKDNERGVTVAKSRAIIWASIFPELRYKFESVTGQQFVSGIKVMVEVSVNFHEQFGLSLIISNINPEYTLGDMARQRIEILKRLKAEGIINMNRELEWCDVPQRIAVISAEGAAGYDDFVKQLHGNQFGLKFYTSFFRATMQGANTVPSVINALNRIHTNMDHFDCVVIIRGGGATSELNAFDNYDLAANIAQFPLPVITGIGHERDNTVIDYVANLRVKTPTAAAEWLIARGVEALDHITELTQLITNIAKDHLTGAKQQLLYYTGSIPYIIENKILQANSNLQKYGQSIPLLVNNKISSAGNNLMNLFGGIRQASEQHIRIEKMRIDNLSKMINLLSPENTLKRGYSITLHNGKAITEKTEVREGDTITSRLLVGDIISEIKKLN